MRVYAVLAKETEQLVALFEDEQHAKNFIENQRVMRNVYKVKPWIIFMKADADKMKDPVKA